MADFDRFVSNDQVHYKLKDGAERADVGD